LANIVVSQESEEPAVDVTEQNAKTPLSSFQYESCVDEEGVPLEIIDFLKPEKVRTYHLIIKRRRR